MRDKVIGAVAILAILVGVVLLERARAGLEIVQDMVGETPVTVMRLPDAEGPAVVIAHGFAGSRQLMAAWQLTLAQAGYITVSYDLEGHGRNPVPMSGDVTRVDGTTRLLMEELGRVTDYAVALPGAEPRVALLGHSMASDIVVRQAIVDPRVEAVVGLSVFSQAVTVEEPRNLLMINGQFEGALRAEAERVMAEIGEEEGDTVGVPGEGFARRAVAAPWVEHVTILYSVEGLWEARNWLDATFGIDGASAVAAIGWPIAAMLFGAVLLALPLSMRLPAGPPPEPLPARAFWAIVLLSGTVPPVALSFFDTRFLPVLVADYLAVHLALYGVIILLCAAGSRRSLSLQGWIWGLALAGFGLMLFGGLLDRYVASFAPEARRVPVLLAILPGAVLAMIGDASLTRATHAALGQRIVVRAAFLGSLGIAVALDFERLFFLVIILPVILLFYASFGMMGRWVGRRTGSVAAVGLGLGIVLAWALGVSFPLFDAGA